MAVPVVTQQGSRRWIYWFVGLGIIGTFVAIIQKTSDNRGTRAVPESDIMCAEFRQRLLSDFLKSKMQSDVVCAPAVGSGGHTSIVIGYAAPFLAKNDMLRKNTLYLTFGIAGETIDKHPGITIDEVAVVDSTRTAFRVTGAFAKDLHKRTIGGDLTDDSAALQFVLKHAQRVNIPLPEPHN